jgi:hypothetical protein
VCNSRSLWTTGVCETLSLCGDAHSFHISSPVCTGACELPVGDVGNRVPRVRPGCRISKSPELHRQDLEIRPPPQVDVPQSLRWDFHFSYLTYGDYCLFLLSIYSFPSYPSASTPGHMERMATHNHQPADSRSRPRSKGHCSGQASRKQPHRPRNSEIYPAFPPTPGSRR